MLESSSEFRLTDDDTTQTTPDGSVTDSSPNRPPKHSSLPDTVHEADHFHTKLLAAKSGSVSALGELLSAFKSYLFVIADARLDPKLRRFGGLSDVVQQSQYEACRNFPKFRGTTHAEFKVWLTKILMHNLIDFQRAAARKRKHHRDPEGDSSVVNVSKRIPGDDPTPSARSASREQVALLHAVLHELSVDQRQVIVKRHFEGLPFREIGKQLERSEDAARKLWYRALEQLRQKTRHVL